LGGSATAGLTGVLAAGLSGFGGSMTGAAATIGATRAAGGAWGAAAGGAAGAGVMATLSSGGDGGVVLQPAPSSMVPAKQAATTDRRVLFMKIQRGVRGFGCHQRSNTVLRHGSRCCHSSIIGVSS
jgi:hypothetical protein